MAHTARHKRQREARGASTTSRRRIARTAALALPAILLVTPGAAARPVAPSAAPCFGFGYSASNPDHYMYPNPSTTYDAQGFAIVDLRSSTTAKIVYEDRSNPVKAKVYGTSGSDLICTGALADRVWAGEGGDWVNGGTGNDRLYGEGGIDTLEGDRGKDTVNGGIGSDFLRGDRYLDLSDPGSPSADRLIGGSGGDDLRGQWGNDVIEGGDGMDLLFGDAGNDIHWGGADDDYLDGDTGDDCYDGGTGFDRAHEEPNEGVDRANSNVEVVEYVFTTIEHGGACSS